MEKEKLKGLLIQLIEQNEKTKQKNFEKNKGLDNRIVTTNGLVNDGYYKGKIQAYKYILKMLDSEE